MKLQEVFDQLAFGELSQLNIGGAGQGVIDGTNQERVLVHINAGLTALHKRFFLREGRTQVDLVPGTLEYALPGDLLKVERVLTDGVTRGIPFELGLNDEADRWSVSTPSARMLRVPADIAAGKGDMLPEELRTAHLEVFYRAGHPRIVGGLGHFDPETIDVAIPDSHLMALCYFVASRAHNPVGLANELAFGNTYFQKYELECQALENEGMRIDRDNRLTNFERNGWV